MNYIDQVGSIMTTDLITVRADTPIGEVKNLFRTNSIHHILVESRVGELEGIISSVDLDRTAHFLLNENELMAKHIMTASPVKVKPEMPLKHVVDYFLDNRYRAIPIVNQDEVLIGIVTPYDIMKALLESFEEAEEEETHFDNV